MMRRLSDVHAIAVTPELCALFISYQSLPDLGVKARIFPSFHAEIKEYPSCEENVQKRNRQTISVEDSALGRL